MPAISVIIPVYNTAPWLRRCLDSVCGQTLEDIQIICVNDGSIDESDAILQEYAAQDTRVLVITFSKNQGVSIARNVGIAVSCGEWIGFVDSDDCIDMDFYENLYRATSSDNFDIVKGSCWSERKKPKYIDYTFNNKIRDDKLNFTGEWWSAIYRREFLEKNGIKFVPGCTNGQDKAFLYDSVLHASDIKVVDNAIYRYSYREGSSDSKILSIKKICSLILMMDTMIDSMNKCIYDTGVYIKEFKKLMYQCYYIANQVSSEDVNDFRQKIGIAFLKFVEKCKEKEMFLCSIDEDISKAIVEKDITALGLLLSTSRIERLRARARIQLSARSRQLRGEAPKLSVNNKMA